MPLTTPLSPEPRIPSPPSSRDFEIHRLALVQFLSTRRIAEKFHISQTRVRQIIARVAEWLTEMLPLKSEQDVEKEKRYAIHLAAAQLQHQIETLQTYWDGTSDPKYQRQQTRAILALARLGAHSHTLDSLAASHSDESELWPVSDRASSLTEGLNLTTPTRRASEGQDLHYPTALETTAASSPSDLRPLTSDFSAPPPGACSPQNPHAPSLEPQASASPAETPCTETDLLLTPENARETLKGLDIMERNLLTYIDQVTPDQTDRLQYLQESLSDLRQSRANFILKLSPDSPPTPISVFP